MPNDIDIDKILLDSSISFVTNALERMRDAFENKDNDTALSEGKSIRNELSTLSNGMRKEVTAELKSQIEAIDKGAQSVIWEMVFNAPMPNRDNQSVRNTLTDMLFQEARAGQGSERKDALDRLVKRLALSDPLTKAHYADLCVEFRLCKRGDFMNALKWESKAKGNGHASPETEASPKGSLPDDDDLAHRWLKAHPYTAFGMGEYRRYGAGYWEKVDKDEVMGEVSRVIREAKTEGIRPTSGRVTSVAELGRLMIVRANELWDNNPDILVVNNGTLHIPTLELREHSHKHYSTSGLPYDYSPDAKAPTWEMFIAQTVPEAHDFLQEFAGYALTVDTSHETALWLYGPPGSGKSTFITGLQAMLNGKSGLLGLADIEKNRFALSQLPGKTLVVNTEQPSGYMQATYILNSIISGEAVTVDRKYYDAIEITPRAKIVWAMNELPRVSEAGNGLFRRVKVVRFPPLETSPDKSVKETIKTEGAGILNWALIGLKRLRERGKFDVPEFVQNATEHFQKTNDVSATFVAEMCLTGKDYHVQSSVLYAAYKTWAEQSGHRPHSSTRMADEWERLGYHRYKSGGKAYWRGIGLLEE